MLFWDHSLYILCAYWCTLLQMLVTKRAEALAALVWASTGGQWRNEGQFWCRCLVRSEPFAHSFSQFSPWENPSTLGGTFPPFISRCRRRRKPTRWSIIFIFVSQCSLAGMFLMFTGLYFVLWAKAKERYANRNRPESEFDVDKPLLSWIISMNT